MKKIVDQLNLATGFVFIIVAIAIINIVIEDTGGSLIKIIIAASLAILSLIFYLIRTLGKERKISKGIQNQDEFSKLVKIHAGNTAFYYSMFLWLLLFAFQDQISETRTLLGFGVLGSAAMYGIASFYYTKTGNIDQE